jgi:hypothetical protein
MGLGEVLGNGRATRARSVLGSRLAGIDHFSEIRERGAHVVRHCLGREIQRLRYLAVRETVQAH